MKCYFKGACGQSGVIKDAQMANTSLSLFCLCELNVSERHHVHRHSTRVPTVSSLSIVRTRAALSSPGSQQCLQEQNIYFLAEASLCRRLPWCEEM